ncbi:MAG: hypothetical protein EBY96_01665, partial [Actinobacteria bacterium]|nr:hypothetical protein [Actinomycetota bacterium]
MFTTGSKYFIGLSALAGVALAVYLIFVGPSSIGGTALFGMIAATGLLAGLSLSTRDGDTESTVGSQAAVSAPSASMWPLVSVLGAVVFLLGTITTTSGASASLGTLTLTNYKFIEPQFNE